MQKLQKHARVAKAPVLAILAWCFVQMGIIQVEAATYYTAIDGVDSNPGSADDPWRTIEKAVDTAGPGDTVIVRAGSYDERVTTSIGGGGLSSRITFRAEGTVIMRGWRVHHPYVTIDGFEITGHAHTRGSEGFIRVNDDGDYLELLNCSIRDGIKTVSDNVTFTAPNSISIPEGGLLAAGFLPGQVIVISRASPESISNTGGYVIASLSDTEVTLSDETPVADEQAVSAFIAASSTYGLGMTTGVEHCVIRGNTFKNLAFDSWAIFGSDHLIEDNVIEQNNGWDAGHFGGSRHVFQRNIIRNCPLVAYQNSPDAFENYSQVPYFDIVFSYNYIEGFAGVLASQKGSNSSSGLLISHNVFVDVGRFSFTHPGTTVEHNTFLRVAKEGNPVVARASHPLLFSTSVGATEGVIRNNVFVDCGEPSNSQSETDTGWYEISGPADTIVAEGNFVAGSGPAFGSKTGWTEGIPLLNGGDPGFVDIDDPLGPDGFPFTADDGLRLQSSSKLVGAGVGGFSPGAYASALTIPDLILEWVDGGDLELSWPETDEVWILQSSSDLTAPWTEFPVSPSLDAGRWKIVFGELDDRMFFRLAR